MFKERAENAAAGTAYRKAKLHVQENKKAYIFGAVGIGIGAAGTLFLMSPQIDVNVVVNNVPS